MKKKIFYIFCAVFVFLGFLGIALRSYVFEANPNILWMNPIYTSISILLIIVGIYGIVYRRKE